MTESDIRSSHQTEVKASPTFMEARPTAVYRTEEHFLVRPDTPPSPESRQPYKQPVQYFERTVSQPPVVAANLVRQLLDENKEPSARLRSLDRNDGTGDHKSEYSHKSDSAIASRPHMSRYGSWSSAGYPMRTVKQVYWSSQHRSGSLGRPEITAPDGTTNESSMDWQADGRLRVERPGGEIGTSARGHMYASNVAVPWRESSEKFTFYIDNRPIMIIKSAQGFVGWDDELKPRVRCDLAEFDVLTIVPAPHGSCYLRGSNGKYLHVYDDHTVWADSQDPTEFMLTMRGSNLVAFKTLQNRYLRAGSDGLVHGDGLSIGDQTLWEFSRRPPTRLIENQNGKEDVDSSHSKWKQPGGGGGSGSFGGSVESPRDNKPQTEIWQNGRWVKSSSASSGFKEPRSFSGGMSTGSSTFDSSRPDVDLTDNDSTSGVYQKTTSYNKTVTSSSYHDYGQPAPPPPQHHRSPPRMDSGGSNSWMGSSQQNSAGIVAAPAPRTAGGTEIQKLFYGTEDRGGGSGFRDTSWRKPGAIYDPSGMIEVHLMPHGGV